MRILNSYKWETHLPIKQQILCLCPLKDRRSQQMFLLAPRKDFLRTERSQKRYSPLGLCTLQHYSWFAASLFVLISQVCAARSPACQLYRCQGKARTRLCQRQPLQTTAVPHMLQIDINKHGLLAPGKRTDRYDSSPMPPAGDRSNNTKRQIFPRPRHRPLGLAGYLGEIICPLKVPGRASHRTPSCFDKDQSRVAVICGVPYQERAEKMNGNWAWIIGAAPAAVKLRIFNTDSREEHAAQVIHDTLLLN